MKSRSKEFLNRAIAATVSAIEIYNKPDFLYREESFAVLAINGWELLLKAKWLIDHNNQIRSLYVMESHTKVDGTKCKKLRTKSTRSGNPFTHSLDYLAKKLVESKTIDNNVWANIQALMEIRDSSIHFYNRTGHFSTRLQEIGTASLKNFVATTKAWFGRDMSEFNFYLMPLSFIALPCHTQAVVLNQQERNFLAFIDNLESANDDNSSPYSVTVNIDIKFTRSKAKDALGVQITKNQNALQVRLTEESIREKYPWDYEHLTNECQKRYTDFKVNNKYHNLRKNLLKENQFGMTRFLDPNNLKSSNKPFFNPNILAEFDKNYTIKLQA